MTILKQLQGKNQLPNEIQFATDDIYTQKLISIAVW